MGCCHTLLVLTQNDSDCQIASLPFPSPAYSTHPDFNSLSLKLLADHDPDKCLPLPDLPWAFPTAPSQTASLVLLGKKSHCLLQTMLCLQMRKEIVLENSHCFCYQGLHSLSCFLGTTSSWLLSGCHCYHCPLPGQQSHKMPLQP